MSVQSVGLLDCWIVGVLDCWIVGVLQCCSVAVLQCPPLLRPRTSLCLQVATDTLATAVGGLWGHWTTIGGTVGALWGSLWGHFRVICGVVWGLKFWAVINLWVQCVYRVDSLGSLDGVFCVHS